MPTTIWASEELADELHQRKKRGESYEDVIWRLIDQADQANRSDRSDQPVDVDDQDDVPVAGDGSPAPAPTSTASGKPVDDWIEGLELPGVGPQLDRRREAVRAAYDLLRERGSIMSGEMKNELYPEYPADYGSKKSWWNNLVLPALRDLAELDEDLYSPPNKRSSSPWQYDT